MTTKAVSAFLWYDDPRPSIFADDPAFSKRSKTNIKTIDENRKKGLSYGTIKGLSKRSDELLITNKLFLKYAKEFKR
ncbi:hypothetical protein UFOVP662_27 [uncultured Caudovirales phage]|uniref:Uncharacterized protein n=1 Tax=uncultured Caudovirales phage TaxID=2100421 RepID=A0A6J5NFB4_9CAUD|nr:hypothetical protein UFOVP662_27 [uncultured Caudovirales phage]CAB4181274.1 hypothetical protein UFOVP1067_27 [uncultured Caudovirales phage]